MRSTKSSPLLRLLNFTLFATVAVAIDTAHSAPAPARLLTLPPLPYGYDALAPAIPEDIMRVHHLKHHAAYTAKANDALDELFASSPQLRLRERDGVGQLRHVLENLPSVTPSALRTTLQNNGGGFVNHAFFWKCLAPAGSTALADAVALQDALVRAFGSVEAFRAKFTASALSVFGSGWVWLERVGVSGELAITTTPNQDSPFFEAGRRPILALDVWEHAYYLAYKNDRKAYVDAFFAVVNWNFVGNEFRAGEEQDPVAAGESKCELVGSTPDVHGKCVP